MVHVRPASVDEVRAVQQQVLRPGGPLPGDRPHPPQWQHLVAVVDGAVVSSHVWVVLAGIRTQR